MLMVPLYPGGSWIMASTSLECSANNLISSTPVSLVTITMEKGGIWSSDNDCNFPARLKEFSELIRTRARLAVTLATVEKKNERSSSSCEEEREEGMLWRRM